MSLNLFLLATDGLFESSSDTTLDILAIASKGVFFNETLLPEVPIINIPPAHRGTSHVAPDKKTIEMYRWYLSRKTYTQQQYYQYTTDANITSKSSRELNRQDLSKKQNKNVPSYDYIREFNRQDLSRRKGS